VLKINHQPQLALLKQVRRIPGVKKVFVASGIRYDMVLGDLRCGRQYLQEMITHHVSGQMKIAPEHSEDQVLHLMGKPGKASLLKFKEMFDQITLAAGKEQYLTYYLIAAHPGCSEQDIQRLKLFTSQKLKVNPEQVQIFTPTPSTYSSVMYYTGLDPFTRQPIFVEKDLRRKERQKYILIRKTVQPAVKKNQPASLTVRPASRSSRPLSRRRTPR
jgi:uncharacterized radical SAM protein YgiQ